MKRLMLIVFFLMALPLIGFSQENQEKEKYTKINPLVKTKSKIQREAFESTALIDNQTNTIYKKGTLEFVMNHRFGLVNGSPKDNDLIGIWGAANIRLGVNYSVTDWATVGFGTTKDSRLQDFNLKLAILKQTTDNKFPVSVSYYGNYTVDARRKENFRHTEDRYSFFSQIIVARRFSRNFSFLVSPSLSHFNVVDNNMRNDMFAVGFGTHYKLTPQTSVIAEYTQPINTYTSMTPDPGFSLGFEFVTGSHAFQVFITNYKAIVPQRNIMFNQNNMFEGDFMIGFNITRLWNF